MVESHYPAPLEAPLTSQENDLLAQFEETIDRGFKSFVEVGHALMAIRDMRLHRGTHQTFEQYCRDRWGIGKTHTYRLIEAAETAVLLSPIGGQILPDNERQIRPLTRVPEEERSAVWQVAVATAPDGRMTAAHVAATVEQWMGLAGPGADIDEGVAEAEDETPDLLPFEPVQAERAPVRFTAYSSESPEWYTPAEVLDLVERVLGTIDLDPCSNLGAPNVRAALHFTQHDDGLAQEWQGRVYMNPPYGDEIGPWIRKLKEEYDAYRTVEAIALVPARTDTQWFKPLWDFPICFVEGRLRFSGHKDSAPFPSALVYMGDNNERFIEVFRTLGVIVGRLD